MQNATVHEQQQQKIEQQTEMSRNACGYSSADSIIIYSKVVVGSGWARTVEIAGTRLGEPFCLSAQTSHVLSPPPPSPPWCVMSLLFTLHAGLIENHGFR